MTEIIKDPPGATGALAWSEQVKMTKEEIDEFLSGRWLCRLATIRKDGSPHNAPLWYYWDGECLYFVLTKNRLSCKNLKRDPRCAAVIDMDDRPLIGMRTNLAMAVHISGNAELYPRSSGSKITINAGPWKGTRTFDECKTTLLQRYGLWERDGALGLTMDKLHRLIWDNEEIKGSQLAKDHEERVLVKIIPEKIQSWDFSKAPIRKL